MNPGNYQRADFFMRKPWGNGATTATTTAGILRSSGQIPPDLVVKSQAIDIIGFTLSLIRRKTSSTTSRRLRKSSF